MVDNVEEGVFFIYLFINLFVLIIGFYYYWSYILW